MIHTFSRAAIEGGIDLVEPYALISISTPKVYGGYGNNRPQAFDLDASAAVLPPDKFRLDILRLAFWDVNILDPLWDNRLIAQARLYSAEDARRVAAFVRGWTIDFVVHCDAGISRSQGMANAIADHLDVEVTHSVRGMPNIHVYRLTWEALRPALTPKGYRAPLVAPDSPALKPSVVLPPKLDPRARIVPEDKYRIRYSD